MRPNHSSRIARRGFLKLSLGASALPWVACARAASAPSGTQGLTTYQLGPRLWVRWNNRLLTCYRAHSSQKYPYLYPVSGPVTGLSLTAETALPYPHHRSLFFGCDRVSGGNYWQEDYERGQIVSEGPRWGRVTKDSVEILDACQWRKPGEEPVMKDQRRIQITVASDRLQFIDWEITWTAVAEAQILKTNHSLFSLRAAADITPNGGGILRNAEGQSGEKATFGQPSGWCDFSGRRERVGANIVEGIALLDHPKNPWSPCPWFTRDYGFLSATPFNFIEQPMVWEAGTSVVLRYRVVLHGGDAQESDLAGVYRDWARG